MLQSYGSWGRRAGPHAAGVLVAPLAGDLVDERAADLAASVLAQVELREARHVVLDLSGIQSVDAQVAQMLGDVAQAVRLLGARALLVGLRAEAARAMDELGGDVAGLERFASLQEAVAAVQARRAA